MTIGTQQTELAVEGMTCAGCVAHVTQALEGVTGVSTARVSLATENATVEHTTGVSDAALIAAVEAAGYGARAIDLTAEGAGDDGARARDAELGRKRLLLIAGIVLSVPTVALGMGAPDFAGKDWLMAALAAPVWLVVGYSFHRGAIAALRHGRASMDTLVSLGSTAAYLYSIYAVLSKRPSYFETAAAIVTLITIGKYLELSARRGSNLALRRLLDLRPSTGLVRAQDGAVREVPIAQVRVGDIVVVPARERIAVDGLVIEGRSALEVSMLTGEPTPREVSEGSEVSAGTLNGDGTLVVRVTATGTATALAHIVEIVRRAQGSQPAVQRLADRIAGIFVPIILAISALTFAGWLVSGHSWTQALLVAIAVLVVACPCALGLATPTAIIAAVGAAAKHGLLFKDAESLERVARVNTVVFDKTGTLTSGAPCVVGVVFPKTMTRDILLDLAASVERGSSHPLAHAIVRAAGDANGAIAERVVAEPGRGLRGVVDGDAIIVGTREFLLEKGVEIPLEAVREGATPVYVARNRDFAGIIELADPLRAQTREAIARLRALGMDLRIVSGDIEAAVSAVANEIGVGVWDAATSPARKAEIVAELRKRGRRVAFIGDGINDAPALATADVGFAMSSGTAIAMETAGIAIVSSDPCAVASAILLGRATLRTIKQNLFWALIYNAVLVPLAALGIVHPIAAAAAMGASSLFVVGNSLVLRRRFELQQ